LLLWYHPYCAIFAPLAPRTIMRAPLVTGGVPVKSYSKFFRSALISPFSKPRPAAITPSAVLLKGIVPVYYSYSLVCHLVTHYIHDCQRCQEVNRESANMALRSFSL